jgi:phosphatidate cytidylyltransferase
VQDLPNRGAQRWADLQKRAASALVLAPLALAAIWLGAGIWAALMAAGTVGVALEWVRLCGSRASRFPGLAVPLAVVVAGAVAVAEQEPLALLLLFFGFAATWLAAGSVSFASGVIYIGIACIAMIWLRQDSIAGRQNVLFLVLVVWASDIGAYLAGRLVGGPRLAPRLSPSKTWAGVAGGLLTAALTGLAAAALLATDGRAWRTSLVACGLAIASQAGDLLESSIKRRFGVKDSGRLIPGHGGLLDRLDGLMAAAPAAALLALLLGRGVVLWR